MNEGKRKLKLGDKDEQRKLKCGFVGGYVKPSGRFWKRYFNKRVRKGGRYKRGNWWWLP